MVRAELWHKLPMNKNAIVSRVRPTIPTRLINIVEMGLVDVYSPIVVCIKSVVEEYKVRTISTQLHSAFPLPCPGESGQTF